MPQYKQLKYAFEGIDIKPSAGKPGFITFKMTEPQFQQFQTNQAKGPPRQEGTEIVKPATPSSEDGDSIQVVVDESESKAHVLSLDPRLLFQV